MKRVSSVLFWNTPVAHVRNVSVTFFFTEVYVCTFKYLIFIIYFKYNNIPTDLTVWFFICSVKRYLSNFKEMTKFDEIICRTRWLNCNSVPKVEVRKIDATVVGKSRPRVAVDRYNKKHLKILKNFNLALSRTAFLFGAKPKSLA